jgi:hypothetical protein
MCKACLKHAPDPQPLAGVGLQGKDRYLLATLAAGPHIMLQALTPCGRPVSLARRATGKDGSLVATLSAGPHTTW